MATLTTSFMKHTNKLERQELEGACIIICFIKKKLIKEVKKTQETCFKTIMIIIYKLKE